MPTPRLDVDTLSAAEIAAGIRAGDTQLFEALFVRYYDPLRRFAGRYIRSDEEGRELVSDLFLTLWRQRESFHLEKSISTYLFSAVRHRAQNVVRDAQRRGHSTTLIEHEDVVPGMAHGVPPTDELLEVQEQVERLWTAVAALPEARRVAVTLRWQEQLGFEEIAEILGTTPAAVRKHVSRALATLRQILGEES